MANYRNFYIAIIMMSSVIMSMPSWADGVLNTTPNKSVQRVVPSGAYTIDYVTISTARHGQGTFTIYRTNGYPQTSGQLTIGTTVPHQARYKKPIKQSTNRHYAQAQIKFNSSHNKGNSGRRIYHRNNGNKHNVYGNNSVTYNNFPNQGYHYQQPGKVVHYYPGHHARQNQGHGYQPSHRQPVNHFTIRQCLGDCSTQSQR